MFSLFITVREMVRSSHDGPVYERRSKRRDEPGNTESDAESEEETLAAKGKRLAARKRPASQMGGIHIQEGAQTVHVERGAPLPQRRGKRKAAAQHGPRPSNHEERVKVTDLKLVPALYSTHPGHIGYRPRVYKKNQGALIKNLRERCPLDGEKEASDYRFHTWFQQDFYQSYLYKERKEQVPIVVMQWVDWEHLEKQDNPIAKEIVAACEVKNVKRIMGFSYNWNTEVIAQFYATIYFDYADEPTLHWMTQGNWYHISYGEFAALLAFDKRDLRRDRIHVENKIATNELGFLYEGDDYDLGYTTNMTPFFKCLNRLFRQTLTPKEGDATKVLGMTRNLLAHMASDGRPFSVFDFIWEEIRLTSITPTRSCPYAPYIMFMIEEVTNLDFEKDGHHLPVRVRIPKNTSAPSRSSRQGTRAAPPSPPKQGPSSPLRAMLKAIFNVCKRNSVKIDKQAHRIKKIERHLNISTSDEESDEDTFENPFEAYELAQRAAASSSHTRAAAPSHGYAEEDNEEEEEEEEYNEEDEGSEGDGAASE